MKTVNRLRSDIILSLLNMNNRRPVIFTGCPGGLILVFIDFHLKSGRSSISSWTDS